MWVNFIKRTECTGTASRKLGSGQKEAKNKNSIRHRSADLRFNKDLDSDEESIQSQLSADDEQLHFESKSPMF